MKTLILTIFIILGCGRKNPLITSQADLNDAHPCRTCGSGGSGDLIDTSNSDSSSGIRGDTGSPGKDASGNEAISGHSEGGSGSPGADTGGSEATSGNSEGATGDSSDTGSIATAGNTNDDIGNEDDESVDLEAENVLKPLLQKAFETSLNLSLVYFAPSIDDLDQIFNQQINELKNDGAVAQLFDEVDLNAPTELNIYDSAAYLYYSDLFGGNGGLSDPEIDAAFKPVISIFPISTKAKKMNQNQLAMITAIQRFAGLITSNPNLSLEPFALDTQSIFYDLFSLITMPKSEQTKIKNVSATNLMSFISLRTKYDLALMDQLLMFLGYVRKIAAIKPDATKLTFASQQNLAKLEAATNYLLKWLLPDPVQFAKLIFMSAFAKNYVEISLAKNLNAAARTTSLLPRILKGAALLGALKNRALFTTNATNTRLSLEQGAQKVIAAQMTTINGILAKMPDYVPLKIKDATLTEIKKLPSLASHVVSFHGLQIYPEQYTTHDYGVYREPLNRLGWQFSVLQLFYDKNDPQSSQQLMSTVLWVAKVCMNDSYLAYLYYQATFASPLEDLKELNFLLWLRKNRTYLLEPLTHVVFESSIMMNEIIYERFTRIAKETEQWRKTYGENSFYKSYVDIAPKFDAQNKANIGYVMQFYTRLKQGIVQTFGDEF